TRAITTGRRRMRRPGSARLLRALGHRQAGVLPGREAAVHLDDALEAHLLGDVGRQRRAPGAVAVEDELLVASEDVLVVGAVGIDPELQHAARAVEGAGDHALALELADVAEVDEDDVVAVESPAGVVEADRADAGLGLVHHLPEALAWLPHRPVLLSARPVHILDSESRPCTPPP